MTPQSLRGLATALIFSRLVRLSKDFCSGSANFTFYSGAVDISRHTAISYKWHGSDPIMYCHAPNGIAARRNGSVSKSNLVRYRQSILLPGFEGPGYANGRPTRPTNRRPNQSNRVRFLLRPIQLRMWKRGPFSKRLKRRGLGSFLLCRLRRRQNGLDSV